MKKAVILFAIFAVLDLVLYILFANRINAGMYFSIEFLPFMFIEIATYGSVIIYDINKKEVKKDN